MSSSSPNCFSKLLSSLSVFSFLPLGRMVSNVKSSSGCEVTRDNFISCIVFSSFSSLARTEKLRQLYPLESMQAILIIIIDFYGAYILRNLSSEAQQNRISRRNRKQGRAKVSIRTRDNRTFMVGMQFGIDMS